MKQLLARRRTRKLMSLMAADLLLFGLTNARSSPPLILIIGFILLTATIYHLAYGVLGAARLYGLALKHKRRLALFVTGVTATAAALQSVGELNTWDVVVLLPMAIIGYGYSFYAKPAPELPEG